MSSNAAMVVIWKVSSTAPTDASWTAAPSTCLADLPALAAVVPTRGMWKTVPEAGSG